MYANGSWAATCKIVEPWVIRAAMNFFTDNQLSVLTDQVDTMLFNQLTPPSVFGTLFDYRVALTLLSADWKDTELLQKKLFQSVKVCAKNTLWFFLLTKSKQGICVVGRCKNHNNSATGRQETTPTLTWKIYCIQLCRSRWQEISWFNGNNGRRSGWSSILQLCVHAKW